LESDYTDIIPIVVDALAATPKSLEKNLKRSGTTVSIPLLQKAAVHSSEQREY